MRVQNLDAELSANNELAQERLEEYEKNCQAYEQKIAEGERER
jgi:hypothetical protein